MAVISMPRVQRGCGYRRVGGTYLFCDMTHVRPCPSLPLGLPERCPTCGEELEQFRGIKLVNPRKFFVQKQDVLFKCADGCPVCYPPEFGAMMWVGKKFYSCRSFVDEALTMGISKRIVRKPKELKPGDPIYLMHPEAFAPEEGHKRGKPGVFIAARVSAFHHIINDEQAKDEEFVKELEDAGLTPVVEYDVPTFCNQFLQQDNGEDEYTDDMMEQAAERMMGFEGCEDG